MSIDYLKIALDQLFYTAKVFGRQCDKFAKQCLAEMEKSVDCKIQAWIVCQKLLQLRARFNGISSELYLLQWKNSNWTIACAI